jgi:hypothetical protein
VGNVDTEIDEDLAFLLADEEEFTPLPTLLIIFLISVAVYCVAQVIIESSELVSGFGILSALEKLPFDFDRRLFWIQCSIVFIIYRLLELLSFLGVIYRVQLAWHFLVGILLAGIITDCGLVYNFTVSDPTRLLGSFTPLTNTLGSTKSSCIKILATTSCWIVLGIAYRSWDASNEAYFSNIATQQEKVDGYIREYQVNRAG